MTIKEIEQSTGLPRASVRFYESEGLISPTRGENGYRSYSQSDLDTLLKIKLLRRLDIPLDDIKALQTNQCSLDSVLSAALARLEQETVHLVQARDLCRALRQDRASYAALDPRPYLQRLDAPAAKETAPQPVYDRLPEAHCPFRRYFARNLDVLIYTALFLFFCQFVLKINVLSGHPLLNLCINFFVPLGLTLVLEPLMLHFFCTTPGKFLFGLKITRGDGSPLSLQEAFVRTTGVLVRGTGLYIPVISNITQVYSLYQTYKGRPLGWDYDLDEVAYWDGSRPGQFYWEFSKSYLKLLLACALSAAIIIGLFHGNIYAMSPRHQGDLTVEQFVENYNDTARFRLQSGQSLTHQLTADGTFEEIIYPGRPNQIIIDSFHSAPPPEFEWTVEDGVLMGVSFALQVEGNTPTTIPYEEMAYTAWSLLYALEGISTDELNQVCEALTQLGGGRTDARDTVSYHHSFACAELDFRMTHRDYILSSFGVLFPVEDGHPICTMEFSLLRTQ